MTANTSPYGPSCGSNPICFRPCSKRFSQAQIAYMRTYSFYKTRPVNPTTKSTPTHRYNCILDPVSRCHARLRIGQEASQPGAHYSCIIALPKSRREISIPRRCMGSCTLFRGPVRILQAVWVLTFFGGGCIHDITWDNRKVYGHFS